MDEEYCELCFAHIQQGKMVDHLKVHGLMTDIRR